MSAGYPRANKGEGYSPLRRWTHFYEGLWLNLWSWATTSPTSTKCGTFWHSERGLFTRYVDTWLPVKTEASGRPTGCDIPTNTKRTLTPSSVPVLLGQFHAKLGQFHAKLVVRQVRPTRQLDTGQKVLPPTPLLPVYGFTRHPVRQLP